MNANISRLEERLVVRCPYHLAQGYLDASLRDRANSRKTDTITLRVPLGVGELTENAIVTVATGNDPMHFDRPWRLHWTPESKGLYPDFDGELTVRADEDYTTSILELRGEYRPPAGIVGAAFDRAVGSRIASSTARALLEEVAAGMVDRYRRDEAAKGQRP